MSWCDAGLSLLSTKPRIETRGTQTKHRNNFMSKSFIH